MGELIMSVNVGALVYHMNNCRDMDYILKNAKQLDKPDLTEFFNRIHVDAAGITTPNVILCLYKELIKLDIGIKDVPLNKYIYRHGDPYNHIELVKFLLDTECSKLRRDNINLAMSYGKEDMVGLLLNYPVTD